MTKEFTPEERAAWLNNLAGKPGSAAMMVEDDKGRLLLVKASYKKYWTMPGGVIDPGESPKQAAIRETREETGLVVASENVEFVQVRYIDGDVRDRYQFIFRTEVDQNFSEKLTLQESEIEKCGFVSKTEITEDRPSYALPVVDWAEGNLPPYLET